MDWLLPTAPTLTRRVNDQRTATSMSASIKTVDTSTEDDRVDEPRWIGCWPTTDATFPVGAHNGHQAATTPPVVPSSEADRPADMSTRFRR